MSPMPENVIDAHTHVFNARYLPIEGITRPHIGDLADPFAALMYNITQSSFDETKEADLAVNAYLKTCEPEQPIDYAEMLWVLIEAQVAKKALRQINLFKSIKHTEWEKMSVGVLEKDPLMRALGEFSVYYNKTFPDKAIPFDINLHANYRGY